MVEAGACCERAGWRNLPRVDAAVENRSTSGVDFMVGTHRVSHELPGILGRRARSDRGTHGDGIMDERWVFCLVVWGLHEVAFFATWALFSALHRSEFAPRFRVAGGKAPPSELSSRAVGEVLRGHAVLLPATAFLFYPAWAFMGGSAGAPGPSLVDVVWQLVVCILVQDTLFYWAHRWLHTPRAFRAIHRKHHDFRYVRGYSAEYAHPLELLVNTASFVLPAILLGTHLITFGVWMTIRVCETVAAHSGYAFSTIASRHAYHHLYASRGCLGSFFGVWDWLMGTDKHWRAWRKTQTHR